MKTCVRYYCFFVRVLSFRFNVSGFSQIGYIVFVDLFKITETVNFYAAFTSNEY